MPGGGAVGLHLPHRAFLDRDRRGLGEIPMDHVPEPAALERVEGLEHELRRVDRPEPAVGDPLALLVEVDLGAGIELLVVPLGGTGAASERPARLGRLLDLAREAQRLLAVHQPADQQAPVTEDPRADQLRRQLGRRHLRHAGAVDGREPVEIRLGVVRSGDLGPRQQGAGPVAQLEDPPLPRGVARGPVLVGQRRDLREQLIGAGYGGGAGLALATKEGDGRNRSRGRGPFGSLRAPRDRPDLDRKVGLVAQRMPSPMRRPVAEVPDHALAVAPRIDALDLEPGAFQQRP